MKALSDRLRLSSDWIDLIDRSRGGEPDIPLLDRVLSEEEPPRRLFQELSAADPACTELEHGADLEEIVGALGWPRAAESAATLSFLGRMGALQPGREAKDLCRHLLATAFAAHGLAARFRIGASVPAFGLGLLHVLGKVFLGTLPKRKLKNLLPRIRRLAPSSEGDLRIQCADGIEVWPHAARRAGLPDRWIQGFALETDEGVRVKSLLHLACQLAEMLGYPAPEKTECACTERDPLPSLSVLDGEALIDISREVERRYAPYAAVLRLPTPGSDHLPRFLYQSTRSLARANSEFEQVQRNLSDRLYDLEMLARVFTRVIKGLEGNPLTFSVLETLIEELQIDGAFMLNREDRDFIGYTARKEEGGEAVIDWVRIDPEELSPSMRACLDRRTALCVDAPAEEALLASCLGKVGRAWVVPACSGDRAVSIIGLGFADSGHARYHHDFGRLLEILAAEIGLSVENARLYDQTCREAGTDAVTGLSNRRSILQILNSEFARFQRKVVPLSVAILDVDHFKSINDRFGHLAGDAVLRFVAGLLKDGLRESDHIGRYGGDEFMIVFPRTRIEEAIPVMERIRGKVADQVPCEGELRGIERITLSVGVASASAATASPDDLIIAADQALYQAKAAGRNCTRS